MAISDRLSTSASCCPGRVSPSEDERLLQLYLESRRAQEGADAAAGRAPQAARADPQAGRPPPRARKSTCRCSKSILGNPEIAVHALVYFQLRALWRAAAARVARFAGQLQQQQTDREQRRQADRVRPDASPRARGFRPTHPGCALPRRHARSAAQADGREAGGDARLLELLRAPAAHRGDRNRARAMGPGRDAGDGPVATIAPISKRRRRRSSAASPSMAAASSTPRSSRMRSSWSTSLSAGGLAMLAKETTSKRLFDVRYGSPH